MWTSRFFLWASVSPFISTSCIGSVGSMIGGLFLWRFLSSIPSLANTAISNIAAHFDHSSRGSLEAFSQNGLIFSGVFSVSCWLPHVIPQIMSGNIMNPNRSINVVFVWFWIKQLLFRNINYRLSFCSWTSVGMQPYQGQLTKQYIINMLLKLIHDNDNEFIYPYRMTNLQQL